MRSSFFAEELLLFKVYTRSQKRALTDINKHCGNVPRGGYIFDGHVRDDDIGARLFRFVSERKNGGLLDISRTSS